MTKHERPWGYFEVLSEGSEWKVKRLVVNPGKRTSLQWHELRDEDWVFVSGDGEINYTREGLEGDSTLVRGQCHHYIFKRAYHRIHNTGTEPLVIIEVQTGTCREDDIHRIEDDFNREVE